MGNGVYWMCHTAQTRASGTSLGIETSFFLQSHPVSGSFDLL